jgi:hypothetical protein
MRNCSIGFDGGTLLGSAEEKKEEIIVKAPSPSVISTQKKVEKATVKALEEERYNVIHIYKVLGKYFGVLSMCTGAILLIVLAFTVLTAQNRLMFLIFNMPISIVALWVATGLISVVVGFLLMGTE